MKKNSKSILPIIVCFFIIISCVEESGEGNNSCKEACNSNLGDCKKSCRLYDENDQIFKTCMNDCDEDYFWCISECGK